MSDGYEGRIDLNYRAKTVLDIVMAERPVLLNQRYDRGVNLPLKYWRQQAHFTTPASGTPEKAIRGLDAVEKLLHRFGLTPEEIAGRTGAPLQALHDVLSGSKHTPFVMVDCEDAVALTQESTEKARRGALQCFTQEEWGPTLPFFRPSGLLLDTCAEDLVTVLSNAAERPAKGKLPIAGIVWPKIEYPEEMNWVCEILTRIEEDMAMDTAEIKLEFLVESANALLYLKEIIEAAGERLVGIIWGIADYAADINLPRIQNDHPMCDWARHEIVNAAGAVNVPAIDCMTLNYPTPIHRGNVGPAEMAQNKTKILEALREVYHDAVHGIKLGMSGKWVGHPLQLLMVLAAYRNAIPQDQIERDLKDLAAYQTSVEAGTGATMLGVGQNAYMADRATDRHLRARLRKACAWGLLDARRALELGLITRQEADEFQA
jgi:citrate lyase beta subunit